MKNQRDGAHDKQVNQAESILSTTAKRFIPASVGDNVAIPIPDIDKGRNEFRNALGVITNISGNGNYVIGTSHGTLKQKYARSQFIPAKGSRLEVDAVPEDNVSPSRSCEKSFDWWCARLP